MGKPASASGGGGGGGSGLPLGWDMDYDGRRWFYTYKPTGQVQYHFPNEGDEFPDFVDARAPAVPLAPEERLESQQQMRRNTNVADSSSSGLLSAARAGGVRMSAQARPVSYIWEGDDEGGSGSGSGGGGGGREVFQPENFMYLGPGAYADVSPLIEEEEEAARRTVAGDPGVSRVASQAGSPEVGVKTTPMGTGSEVSPPAMQASAVPETEAPAAAAAPEEREAVPAVEVEVEPVIHMLDSREMPHELPAEERYHPNPVGIIAEMATEHTAQAQVETDPPPVEIGDSSVLAPVEVALAKGIAGEKEKAGQDVESTPEKPAEKTSEEKELVRKQDDVPPKLTIVAKPPSTQYQPYTPGQAGPSEQTVSQPVSNKRLSLQRDPSLMMKGASKDVVIDPGSVPAALAPRKHSHSISQSSITEDKALDMGGETTKTRQSLEKDLAAVPPALQPSRTDGPSGPVGNTIDNTAPAPEGQDASSNQPVGVSKFPSVLKPARGRAPTQPAAPGSTGPSEHATSFTPPPLKSYQLPPDPVPSEVVNVAGLPATQAPLTQGPVTQPFLAQQQQQPVRPATAFTYQRQSSAPGPEAMGIPQAVPPLGLPSHVAGISRPASTPAVVAPLKLSRQLSRRPLPETLREHPGGQNKFSQPPYTGPTSASEIAQANDRGTPASAGSGTVSPLLSRSGRSDSASMQTPSPLDSASKGRGPSTTSLHHSISNDTVFTPSPVSTTPGSGGQPTRRPSSSLRNSISGPIPVQSPPSHGPPVPSKVPLEQESYFPPQDAVRTDKAAQSPGPARPPKEHQSKPQTPVSQQGPQGPDPSSGYGLSRIDERHEDFNATRSPSAQVSPSTLARRHSTASSIQQSRPPTVSSISSLENIRSFSPDDPRISTLSQTNEQMYGQGQMPPPGQFPPPQGQFPPQGHVIPPGQQPPPVQQFPQGPHPQGHGFVPGPVPPQGIDPRQAGYPVQYQPVHHQSPGGLGHHRQQTWHPQAQPHPQVQPYPQGQPQLQMMQGPGWNQPPGQGPPNFKDKDKEHKWTKWFKGQKGTTLSKAPPGLASPPITGHPPPQQPGLSNPGLGQMPTGGLQNKPNPNVQHVRVPSGHFPQAGSPHNGMAMAQPQWQPPHGPPGPHPQGLQGPPRGPAGPQSPAHHRQGPPGPGPQQRISAPLQMNQGPPLPPAMHPAQAQVRAQVMALNPNTNPNRSDRPAINPGDALGSHPPSIPPLGTGPANAAKQAQRSSVIGPPAQWATGGGPSAGSSAPNTPGPKPGPVMQGDKWARRPAGDYSGGGWG